MLVATIGLATERHKEVRREENDEARIPNFCLDRMLAICNTVV